MKASKTVSPREAAVRLGCGMKRIYELLYSGKLAASKRNNHWLIRGSAIEERLKRRETRE